MNPIGEPDAGNRHVRFDERGWETGDRQSLKHRAHPRLYPSRPNMADGERGPIADLRAAANGLPTAIFDVSRFRASTSGGGGREAAVSSGGTALGTHLVGAGPIARLLRGRRYSTTEWEARRRSGQQFCRAGRERFARPRNDL